MKKKLQILFSALMFLILGNSLSGPAHATIYSYTDKNGVVHFTNVPSDPRYKPLRGKGERLQISGREIIYDSHIYDAGNLYDIDPLLIKAVIKQESNFDRYAISKKGASGLMQLMPGTAQDMNVTDLFNPRENIFGGVRYLKKLSNLFDGDLKLILASYNAGPDRVRLTNTIPDIRETRNYVRAVLAFYEDYRNNY